MIPVTSNLRRRVDEVALLSVDLSGKTALVTGATSGLGNATALALAERGALVIIGVRDVDAGVLVSKEINDSLSGSQTGRVIVGPPLDLGSMDSVKAFAKEIASKHPSIDLLVNNAGVNFLPETFTPDGITTLVQINFLGPAVLTRLLEKPLLAAAAKANGGVANVVHVASAAHRYASIAGDTKTFTSSGLNQGSYAATKLANVVFAYECQRRWGSVGVTSSAVDPGAVFSKLWERDAFFSKTWVLSLLRALYAPPRDGATAVVLACLAPFHESFETNETNGAKSNEDDDDGDSASRFRHYARGLFASFPVTHCGPGDSRALDEKKSLGVLRKIFWNAHLVGWGLFTLMCSVLDWPARRWIPKWVPFGVASVAQNTFEVPSSPGSYDETTGKALWELAGSAARLR